MPYLILEYSDNLAHKPPVNDLFQECHKALTRILPTELKSCKSRAMEYSHYYLGDGAPNYAFIHLTVRFFSGRSAETIANAAQALMSLLQNHFAQGDQKINISIEMVEMEKSNYFKAEAG